MKRIAKMVATIMIAAMVVTSVGLGNMTRVSAKGPVKKIKVVGAKKKLTLKVGEQKKYKVKIKAKKKKNKFTVKSTDKKVVKAKKKGKRIVLTALKVGKAKVIVRSKANKKKKYVIKVKVLAAEQETSKPAETTKPTETTVVPETTTVQEITTAQETTTVPETTTEPETTTKEIETKYTSSGTYMEQEGTVFDDKIKLDNDKGHTANAEEIISIDNPIEGLEYVVEEGTVHVKGKINQTGKIPTTVFVKDTNEDVWACDILFVVTNDTYFAVMDFEQTRYIDESEVGQNHTEHYPLIVFGGSGSFDYEITDNPQGAFSIDNNNEYPFKLSTEVQYGTYSAKVRVYDKNNHDIYSDLELKINLKRAIRVYGRVTLLSGPPVRRAIINFENVECADTPYLEPIQLIQAYADDEGYYWQSFEPNTSCWAYAVQECYYDPEVGGLASDGALLQIKDEDIELNFLIDNS